MTRKQNETITRINQTFEYNLKLIEEIKNYSIDAAVIFSVSLMETLLCEYFYFSRNSWFDHCRKPFNAIPILDSPLARNEILKYLTRGLTDEFFKIRYIYENTTPQPDLVALYELLGPDKKRINFQSLNNQDNRSATKVYKIFLNIDLKYCLDPDKNKSIECWNILKKMVTARHYIIHRGKKSDITISMIDTSVESLKYLRVDLQEKLKIFYTNPN
ncbi:MAG: hypothetical protein BWY93_00787 [Euryarchaeota archaeon ADurb.BinA087]|nr:MAG: hypothetical protein BWY93_00787 [Euryarchaeota archaeon ADurb.BinA087]